MTQTNSSDLTRTTLAVLFIGIIIAAVLYANGETAATGIRKFARRLASQSGDDVAVLSAKAIRGVALGILITALVQSALGGIGLFLAGVPAAVLLTAVMLMLCIAQVGPGLVLILAAIWLFYGGHNLAGSLFSVWAILVCTIDNFLRPVLIRKGVDLTMLLIITGVIGGLIGFGIIGLFIGPVILAVTFTLLRAWVSRGEIWRRRSLRKARSQLWKNDFETVTVIVLENCWHRPKVNTVQ